jgi:transcription-repair coupling factor (superfamily II helicase)
VVSSSEPWRTFAATIRASSPYRQLIGGVAVARRLPLPAAAWVLDLLAEDRARPLLAIVPREADALAWVEAAELFGRGAEHLPAPSLTPYHEADPPLSVTATEAQVLDRLRKGEVSALVATPRALFRRLPSTAALDAATLEITPGEEHSVERLVAHLAAHGYRRVDLVGEVGEYTVRGGVFDLFPPGEPSPLRLDLFGDTVESVRSFSPDDQRSLEAVPRLRVLPVSVFRSGPEQAEELAELLARSLGGNLGMDAAEKLAGLRERGRFTGWQHYLPLVNETAFLGDLLRHPLVVAVDPPRLFEEIDRHMSQVDSEHQAFVEQALLAVAPDFLEQPAERVRGLVESCDLRIDELVEASGTAAEFAAATTDRLVDQLPRFPREWETATARGERLVVVTPPEHRTRIERLCETYELPFGDGGVECVAGELERGFRLPAAGLVLFGERQLFARLPPRSQAGRAASRLVSGLRDLRLGDFVVHADHGIGQFVRLRAVAGEGPEAVPPMPPGLAPAVAGEVEVMEIEYGGGRNLLVPLSRLDLVHRYSGIEGVAPRLDRLGGTSWGRRKQKVRRGMLRMAGDLLKLYAERQLARAPAIGENSDLMTQFEALFEFEETPDQLTAVEAIRADLERQSPMDRLLVGDVGFGKTEVAMRAAFKTVDSGYQVAVLAPTTILADQHLETFQQRFREFPVRVEMVSRFRSAAEIREIRSALEAGKVDILIGTHRLLSRDIQIPRLGLLVVDEEQRFGVAQKERLRQLKKTVHVLSMTATPVPRTLQLSLVGVRDLSLIETPPRDRMAVDTAIVPFDRTLIREAIDFERERGGQIYFVYNRVEGIEEMAGLLRELVPDLRLTIGHGQMDEGELSKRMHAFKRGDHDLLLATTIIENGIDIPNVNTMIIHRADRFGLAQLYQLRGRVGRSTHLAYCYLMVSSDRLLSEDARHRLQAIREFSDLGAGFRIAARDLEIRGAGNLLGAEQSGHIAAVGIEAYLKMLEETVRELKGETVAVAPSVALDLPVTTAIPPDYLGDANLRLEIYRRIAAGEGDGREILDELRDRFGPPPEPVQRLVEVASLKRLAEQLRVQTISMKGAKLQIRMRRDSPVDPDRLIRLVSEIPGAGFSPGGVLSLPVGSGSAAVESARSTLERLL